MHLRFLKRQQHNRDRKKNHSSWKEFVGMRAAIRRPSSIMIFCATRVSCSSEESKVDELELKINFSTWIQEGLILWQGHPIQDNLFSDESPSNYIALGIKSSMYICQLKIIPIDNITILHYKVKSKSYHSCICSFFIDNWLWQKII